MEMVMDFFKFFNVFVLATADHYSAIIGLTLTFSVAVMANFVLFRPLNRIKDLCDTGYGFQVSNDTYGKSKKELVNQVRRLKKRGDIPPVYPNGWFAILESHDLKIGQVRPVSALGENWVAFRTEEGKACILDAYCAHLGAHLGIGGKVIGNCIECPFHGWQFQGHDGQCTAVPYAKKVPEFARVKSWPVEEANGFIFVWYHAEEEKPLWNVPLITEVESKQWGYRGRTEYLINCHIQEIPENGADMAHLGHLHAPSVLFGSDLRLTSEHAASAERGQSTTSSQEQRAFTSSSKWNLSSLLKLRHHWSAAWSPEPSPDSHVAISTLHHDFRIFDKWPIMVMKVQAKQIGPGLVHLNIETTLGRCVIIQTVTPVEPLVQRVVHRLYTAPILVTPYAKLLLLGEAIMFERDVMIWNHKTYIGAPILVTEDKTLGKHRRWYKQFYSENSPRLDVQPKNGFDW